MTSDGNNEEASRLSLSSGDVLQNWYAESKSAEMRELGIVVRKGVYNDWYEFLLDRIQVPRSNNKGGTHTRNNDGKEI